MTYIFTSAQMKTTVENRSLTTASGLNENQRTATVMYGLRALGIEIKGDDISHYYRPGTGFTEKGLRAIVPLLAKGNYFANPRNLNVFSEVVKLDIAGKFRSGEISKSPDNDPASIYQSPDNLVPFLIGDTLGKDVALAKMAYMALGIMDYQTFTEKCGSNWTFYSTPEQKATKDFQQQFNVKLEENDQPGRLGKKTVSAIVEALEGERTRLYQGI